MTLDIFRILKEDPWIKPGILFLELNESVSKRTYIKVVSKAIDLCLDICYIFSIEMNER